MIKVAILTHVGDITLATQLANQIKALGGASTHQAHIIAASGLTNKEVSALKDLLAASFYSVDVSIVKAYETKDPLAPQPAMHTQAANSMLRAAVSALEESGNTSPVLLLEPDTTILKREWLDEIEAEYTKARAAGFQILGAKIALREYDHKIYRRRPPFAGLIRKLISVKPNTRGETYSPIPVVIPPNFSQITEIFKKSRFEPWEIQSRKELGAKIKDTNLIEHAHDSTNFKTLDGPMKSMFSFDAPAEDKSPRTLYTCGGAVLVHGTKDNSLFEAYHAEPVVIEPTTTAPATPAPVTVATEPTAAEQEAPIEEDEPIARWEDSRVEASDPEFVEVDKSLVMGVDTAYVGGDGVVVVEVSAESAEEPVDARKAALANRGKRR